MSIIYVDAEERPVSVLRRRVIMVLGILLVVAATNAALLLAVQLAQVRAYPLPRPAVALATRGKLNAGVAVAFSAAGTQGRDLSYIWDFGDGQTLQASSVGMVTHVYKSGGQYAVTLTAVDPVGHRVARSLAITVLPSLPVAAFASQRDPFQSLMMTFDASKSKGSNIQSYRWTFGDGATAATPDPVTQHTYAHAGTYTVTLAVTDGAGQTGSVRTAVPVLPPPPLGQINGDYLGAVNQPVTLYFAPDLNYDAHSAGPLTYLWNFGDGQTSRTGPNVTHVYTQAGSYQITLTVADRYGQSSQFQYSLVVN
jgi:PKD repeat protein